MKNFLRLRRVGPLTVLHHAGPRPVLVKPPRASILHSYHRQSSGKQAMVQVRAHFRSEILRTSARLRTLMARSQVLDHDPGYLQTSCKDVPVSRSM